VLLIHVLISIFLRCSIAEPDYFLYHQQINLAEEDIVQEAFHSAQIKLEAVLTQYEFRFAKDLLLASQINLLLGQIEEGKYWAKEAFRGGYTLNCIRHIGVFKRKLTVSDWEQLESSYPKLRKTYLQKINLDLLQEFSRRYGVEQEAKRTDRYRTVVQRNFDRIKELMENEVGFPGEASIGIDYSRLAPQLTDCSGGNSKVIVTLLHYDHPIAHIGEEKFVKAIKQGQLHPREFGQIYSFEKSQVSILYRENAKNIPSITDYQLNFPFSTKSADIEKVNLDRARFGIGKYQVDQQKEETERKYGLKLRFNTDL